MSQQFAVVHRLHADHLVFSCSKSEQKQLNTWVSFQSAEQPLMGQFSVSGNSLTDKSTLLAKFAGGSIDAQTMIASIGLLLEKGETLSLSNILSNRESLYGDDITLDQASRKPTSDNVGTDAVDIFMLNSDPTDYIKEYSFYFYPSPNQRVHQISECGTRRVC